MKAPTLRMYDEIIVDNFAGGGGASLGIETALGRSPDIAINHDPEAIAMHRINHPKTEHYIEDVFDVDPQVACQGRPVGLAWFSPDCSHFSSARGSKPNRDKKVRGLAWVVVRWAKSVRPRVIILENVQEFQTWGPLDHEGRIIKARAGEEFRFWWAQLEHLGYQVEMKLLRACDYGAPTTRLRLFIIARCDGEPIVWPEPSHGPGRALPWRVAADCIDFGLPCPSIFMSKAEARKYKRDTGMKGTLKRPLSDKTLRRIRRGLDKYVFGARKPFIVPVNHGGVGRDDRRVHDVDEPVRTITGANRGELAVIQPYIARTAHGDVDKAGHRRGRGEHDVGDSLPTVCASGTDFAVVAPTMVQTSWGERKGQKPRCLDLHKPLGCVMAGGVKHAVVSARMQQVASFLSMGYSETKSGGPNHSRSVEDPTGAVTVRDHHNVVAANLLKLRGTSEAHLGANPDITEAVPTISAGGNHIAEVRAFLTKYYGKSDSGACDAPVDTLTTKHRFGIVTIEGTDYQITDIGMRMLTPRELFRAQGFPDSYIIDPVIETTDKRGRTKLAPLTLGAQVRMCGNSVCPPIATALVSANYTQRQIERVVPMMEVA